ncbi:MAG: peptidylprolyl isomerase [Frankiaceae bacterium]|nr:peptidylprolyl isomerase [Arenimonas sp.]
MNNPTLPAFGSRLIGRFAATMLVLGSVFALPAIAQTESTAVALPNATPDQPAAVAGPRVLLETSMGRIVVELYPEKAPRTVANFLSYVRDGHYNGTIFHRVIADLLVQGGGYTPDLEIKPERAGIPNEANNGLSNLRGTLSAARRPVDKDSARAQFFFNTVDNRQFDFRNDSTPALTGYCVFGRVVEGMDIIDKIRLVPTTARAPLRGDVPASPVLVERAAVLDP